jgi:peptidoglycan/xylan/chitin deacetylase (PgdA/CDA1 family)
LSWDEVRALISSPLVAVGAHTHSHPRLCNLSEEEIRDELRLSRERLEQEVGSPVRHFAYPHGGSKDVRTGTSVICRSSGFETAVTTIGRNLITDDARSPMALPRFGVSGVDQDISRLLLGLTDWEAFRSPQRHRRLRASTQFF